MNESKLKNFKIYGAPWWMALISSALILVSAYTGVLATDFPSIMALILAYGIIFYEIGEIVPIWNSYIGGGVLAAFFGTALIKQFGLVPTGYVDALNEFTSGDSVNFLTFFIILLITGSILGLEKDILMKSFAGYLPAILGGLACAMFFGVAVGLVFGVDPATTIIKYVLPVMGGGNGAGAVPMSEIYESATGDSATNYYAFAIIILTIANIMSIIAGGLLNKLGEIKPSLTGDRKTLLRNSGEIAREDEKVDVTIKDMGAALLVGVTAYAVGQLFSGLILPTIFGAAIHEFAYMIIFVVILAATGVVPVRIREGAKRLQKFITTTGSVIVMAGLGFDFDIKELIDACTLSNCVIALFIVIGAVVGSAVVGYLVGFYPIDSAVTAGLCMANRGGNFYYKGNVMAQGQNNSNQILFGNVKILFYNYTYL